MSANRYIYHGTDLRTLEERIYWKRMILFALALNFLILMFDTWLAAEFYIICILIMIRFSQYEKRIQAGVQGENAVLEKLKSLDDCAQIFTNVKVPRKDAKPREIDLIYICHQGIFVCEVKHLRGTVKGDSRGRRWIQTKRTKKGRLVSKQISNPIHQAYGEANDLRKYIDDIPVARHKKFVHPKVILLADKLEVSSRHVLSLQTLPSMINGKHRLSDQDILLIAERIQNLCIS